MAAHGYIKHQDVLAVGKGEEIEGDEDADFKEGWDVIRKV